MRLGLNSNAWNFRWLSGVPNMAVSSSTPQDANMATGCSPSDCQTCPGRVVCHCLQVTEEFVVEAVQWLGLRTVKEIQQYTCAGDGCTACHTELRKIIDEHSYPSS